MTVASYSLPWGRSPRVRAAIEWLRATRNLTGRKRTRRLTEATVCVRASKDGRGVGVPIRQRVTDDPAPGQER